METAHRILVAASFAEVGRLVRDVFVHQGFEVDLVSTGQAALELAGKKSYRLFVLDANLPGRNGLDVVGELRLKGVNTPAVLMASALSEEQEKRLSALAGVAFLAKPFTPEDLTSAISRAGA